MNHYLRHRLILLLMLVSVLVAPQMVTGELEVAVLTVSLHYYTNSLADLQDQSKCDGWGSRTCDITLAIFVSLNTDGDLFYFQQPDSYKYRRYVIFEGTIGRTQPRLSTISVRLPKAALQKGKAVLMINVDDMKNDGTRRRMDTLRVDLRVEPPYYNEFMLLFTPGRKTNSFMSISYSILCEDPNVHGTRCEQYCKPHDDSTNGHYTCGDRGEKVCLDGWIEPDKDCKVPSLCSAGPCQQGSTCIELPASKDYWCSCDAVHYGKNCQYDDGVSCPSNLCLNGGTCTKMGSSSAIDQVRCSCPMGYQGDRCQTEVDRCKAYSPCGAGSTCYALPHGFACACAPGFTGLNCSDDIDECSQGDNPCPGGGTCVNQPAGSFTCQCPPGLRGRLCELDVDECQASPPPCRPGYRCVNTVGGHQCVLLDRDECVGVVCGGNGVCVDLPYKYYCQCPAGFSGANCSHSVSQSFANRLLQSSHGVTLATPPGAFAVATAAPVATAGLVASDGE